ncbi:MAG: hypothetical protein AAF714_03315 [Pseudomonadota bacterium]
MTYLSDEVREGLEAARAKQTRRKSRLRVETGSGYFPVLRLWGDGFSVDRDSAPNLRGLVDLYDGPRHLYQALIVTSSEDAGERRFEFKRNTMADDAAPLDFVREEPTPIALLKGWDMN